jgi:hypothetical protein
MEVIRNFYANVTAKYPDKASLPALAREQRSEQS